MKEFLIDNFGKAVFSLSKHSISYYMIKFFFQRFFLTVRNAVGRVSVCSVV